MDSPSQLWQAAPWQLVKLRQQVQSFIGRSLGWILGFVASLAGSQVAGRAEEPFHVFAPHKANQALMDWEVSVRGDFRRRAPLALPFSPTSIVANGAGDTLFLTAESQGQHAPQLGLVTRRTEALLRGSEKLRLVDTQPLDHPSSYLGLDRTEQFLMSVSYQAGAISTFRIETDRLHFLGEHSVPRKFAHSIVTSHGNNFAYVPCVKQNNAIFQFAFDEQSGHLQPLKPFDARPPAMFGPRHSVLHPNLPLVYFSNEQQLGISVYSIEENGNLEGIQHVSSMPRREPYEPGKRTLHASSLAIDSKGRWVFLALRDFVEDEDSVFTFRVARDGRLVPVSRARVGDIPWKIALSPEEEYLIVSEAFDQTVASFRVQQDGTLDFVARQNWGSEVRDFVTLR